MRARFPRAAITASTSARLADFIESIRRTRDVVRSRTQTAAIRRARELRKEQDLDLQAFGVRSTRYYLESSLYTDGLVERHGDALVAAGKTYEKDGALFCARPTSATTRIA